MMDGKSQAWRDAADHDQGRVDDVAPHGRSLGDAAKSVATH